MRHSVHSIFYDQAAEYEVAGRYDDALVMLYQVHRWVPTDPDLWLRMGVLSFLITDRDWLERHGKLGGHLADMGAVNADLYLLRACELAPERAMAHFWHGWVRHALYQDAPDAIARLTRAIALDPQHPYAHAALARLALETDSAGAERHLRAAIARLPESARFHYDLGTCLARQGRAAEAREAFEAAAAAPALPAGEGALGAYLAREFHASAAEVSEWARRFYADVLGSEPSSR